MDERERAYIRENLSTLIEDTDINESFMAYLYSKHILSKDDLETLKAAVQKHERAQKFYTMIETRVDGYFHLHEALSTTRQSGVANLIEKGPYRKVWNKTTLPKTLDSTENRDSVSSSFHSPVPWKRPKHLRVPHSNPSETFTGRSKPLKKFIQWMKSKVNYVVICGMGGVGKTEFTKSAVHLMQNDCNCSFCSENKKEKPENPIFDNVIWINAERAHEDITFLAAEFHVNLKDQNQSQKDLRTVVNHLYAKLELQKTLLVFDNVPESNFMQTYMPDSTPSVSNLHFVMICRDCRWLFEKQIFLEGLEPTEAIEMVRKGLKISVENTQFDGIEDLVSRLGFYPIAIEQAISYIKKSRIKRIGPKDYIKLLDENTYKILSQKILHTIDSRKTTTETISLALKSIEREEHGKLALQILRVMSFMASDAIPATIFLGMCKESEILNDSISLLQGLAVLKLDNDNEGNQSFISVHRLVQDILRCMIKVENPEGESERIAISKAINLLNWNMNISCINHLVATWRHAVQHKELVLKYADSFPVDIAFHMINEVRYWMALEFLSAQEKELTKFLSYENNCAILIKVLRFKGSALLELGKDQESLEFFEMLGEKAVQYLAPDDPGYLGLRYDKARILVSNRQNTDALKAYDEIYKCLKNSLGDSENSNTIQVLISQAEILRHMKDFDGAEAKLNLVVKHLDVLDENLKFEEQIRVDYSFALIEWGRGNFDQAIAAIRSLLSRGQCKPDLPKQLQHKMQESLATFLYSTGNIQEALAAHENHRKALIECVGPTHFSVVVANLNVATCFYDLGEKEKGLGIAKLAYETRCKDFGKDDFYTIYVGGNYGKLLAKEGHTELAKPLIKLALQSEKFINKTSEATVKELRYLMPILDDTNS